MAINRMTIIKASSDADYRRGQDIFLIDKRITDFETDFNPVTHTPMVRATVSDANGSCHDTEVSIDENENQIVGSYCSCPGFYQTEGLCPHCVAILLKYISRRHILAASDASSKASSRLGQTIIESYLRQHTPAPSMPSVSGNIMLEPTLHDDNGRISVSFKIGTQKKYVVKDLLELARLVREREIYAYGKSLRFCHEREAFAEDSRPLLDFILQQTQDYTYHFHHMIEYSYRFQTMKALRMLPLSPSAVDELLKLLIGETVHFQSNDQTCSLQIIDADPLLTLTIQAKGGSGFELSLDSLRLFSGSRILWLLKDTCLYHCTEAFKKDMQLFLSEIERQKTTHILLSKKQMTPFCGTVLKAIGPHMDIQAIDLELAHFMPPEAEFHIYLDTPRENTVSCTAYAYYGDEQIALKTPITSENGYRDAARERKVLAAIRTYFSDTAPDNSLDGDFIIDGDEQAVFIFLEQGLPHFYQLGKVYISENMKGLRIVPSPRAAIGVSISGGLLQLDIHSGDLPYDELAGILNSYRRRKKYYKLKSGEYLRLENNALSVLSELADSLHLSEKDIRNEKISVPLYRSAYVDSLLTHRSRDIQAQRDHHFKALIRDLKSVADSDYDVPAQQKPLLRDYQKTGFRWLQTIASLGFGGILADDMGLGKTLQMITLLAYAKQTLPGCVSLIICPSALVYNWDSEIERFAPELTVLLITGTALERQEKLRHWQSYDILITSYDMLKRDIEVYEPLSFRYEILDEAQYIKNHSTLAARSVSRIHSVTRFALTGTPIENRLSELWSIFDYLMPGFLYPYRYFKEAIEQPIVEEKDEIAAQRLKQMVQPFILRRLKTDVLKELPDKLEHAVYTQMTAEQQKLYHAHALQLQQGLSVQSDAAFRSGKLQILAELTKLRQLCCDPSLVYENYNGGSAKLDTCIQLIRNAQSGGHKVLLFSQFTSMLDIIERRLKTERILYYRLDGSTRSEQRTRLVSSFNANAIPVFLISLKAGGTGLNLTGADMVIHYDPWWNVAAQNQATDRAHRIGQSKTVTVYKLIARHTIEERILKLQDAKKELADQIISGEGISAAQLTKEDLLNILQ